MTIADAHQRRHPELVSGPIEQANSALAIQARTRSAVLPNYAPGMVEKWVLKRVQDDELIVL